MAAPSAFAEFVAGIVYPPIFCDSSGPDRYFRYSMPDVRHFCILKYARAVSSLNASVALARSGFNQEVCILIRVMTEASTLVEWALESLEPGAPHKASVEAHVALYFADRDRGSGVAHKPANIKQEDIHRDIAKIMDQRLAGLDLPERTSTKDLMSRVFLTYSYYVHARYPEAMDMFGGTPARLHVQGMRNTPKDAETLDIIEVFLTTLELTARRMIASVDLEDRIQRHALLSEWLTAARVEPVPK